MIMTMFCPLKLSSSDGTVLYEQPLPNSALSQRALCLQMGKETRDNLQSLTIYNDEIRNLSAGITMKFGEHTLNLKAEIVGHMLDGKAAKLYTGLGDAYCDLCLYSKQECADISIVVVGFTITRSIKYIIDYFAENVDENG